MLFLWSCFAVFVGGIVATNSQTQCNFPPELWCSSEEIARNCEVTRQCKQLLQASSRNDAEPVNLAVYMESRCSDCRNFFTAQLWPTWKKVGRIMNLTLIPYGNAMQIKTKSGWNFTCQHGPDECLGNLIQTCAIFTVQDVSVYFPFINCIETTMVTPALSYKSCAKKFGIDPDMIWKCASGPYGNSLEHEMAEITNRLDPPHTFVPWITLNGVHTDDIQRLAENNLLKLICDTYKGQKPKACLELLKEHHRSRN